MSKDDKAISRLEARKAAVATALASCGSPKQRRRLMAETVDIDLKLAKLRHVLPEYR